MEDFYERPVFLAADAQSCTFYIAPCSKKDEIANLIEAYFGSVTEDPTGPYTVKLCDPDDQACPVDGAKEWFNIKFVQDSIARGQQQPLHLYCTDDSPVNSACQQVLWRKCTWQEARTQIQLKIASEPDSMPAKGKDFRPYSEKERIKIISYIEQTSNMHRVNGKTLWKEMEGRKVLHNRSWQSMKEHFCKYIAPEIKKGMSSTYSKILSSEIQPQHSPSQHNDDDKRLDLEHQLLSSAACSRDNMNIDSAVDEKESNEISLRPLKRMETVFQQIPVNGDNDDALRNERMKDSDVVGESNSDSASELEEPESASDNTEWLDSRTNKTRNKHQKKAHQRTVGYREPYCHAEDQAIIQHIVDNNFFDLVKGRQMWQDMEANFATGRTWQSLKNRYLKHIVLNLSSYKLTQEDRLYIKKGAKKDQSRVQKHIYL